MKYKVIHSLNKKNPDNFDLPGTVLNINAKDYDLEKPKPLPEIGKDDQDNPILESCENQRVYLDGDTCFVRLHVTFEQYHLFVNNNYLLYHDKDLSGGLDLLEFSEFLSCVNKPNMESVKEHKAFEATFTKTEWEERRRMCGQLK